MVIIYSYSTECHKRLWHSCLPTIHVDCVCYRSVTGFGSCATEIHEPCQVGNEAALRGIFRVPQGCLGPAAFLRYMPQACIEGVFVQERVYMKENYNNEVMYYTFPDFEQFYFLVHAFSSREGGVSEGYYSSMNLGIKTDDSKENILKNYELFTDAVGIKLEDVVIGNLNHGSNVRVATRNDAGCGILKPFNYVNVDALVTNEPNLAITVTCADCVPVFFVDPVKKAIGIAHSGWKGTAQEISARVVEKMVEEYGCKPEDIYAGVGPCIGMCCYEVSRDVFEEFLEFDYLDDAWYFEKDDDKFDLDLSRIIFGTLAYSGILPEHISISGLCTCCNNDVLFSHRAQKGKRGTMAGMIMLKGE